MLVLLSLLYLALPYLLFAWGWLWWPYAAAVWLAVLGALAGAALRAGRFQGPPLSDEPHAPWLNWGGLLLVTLGLLALSGVGGLGLQNSDWLKHNAILHELSAQTWPVPYPPTPGHPQGSYLTYYLAYYLPAAAVGRVAGLTAAHWTLILWTFLGLVLVALWLRRLLGSRRWVFWAAWFALSGMDAAGVWLRGLRGAGPWPIHMETWAALGQYSSNVTLLVWVPQHMLPGWLATAMLVDLTERYEDVSLAGLIAALTALWSPFVTLGLLPLAIVQLFRARLRTAWSFANLVASPLLVLLVLLYLSSVNPGQIPSEWNILHYERPWFLRMYPVFCLLEFGAYVLLLRWHLRGPETRWNRTWLWAVGITLLVLPLYRVGEANDLVMRASIPALTLLWIVVLRVVRSPAFRWEQWSSSLLAGCLMIGAIQPMAELGAQVDGSYRGLHYFDNKPEASVLDLPEKYQPQYLGRPEAFFYRHLAPAQP